MHIDLKDKSSEKNEQITMNNLYAFLHNEKKVRNKSSAAIHQHTEIISKTQQDGQDKENCIAWSNK